MKISFIPVLTFVSYVSAGLLAGSDSSQNGYSYSLPAPQPTYSVPASSISVASGSLSFAPSAPSNVVQVYRQGKPEAAVFTQQDSPDVVKLLLGDGSAAAVAAAAHAKKVHHQKLYAQTKTNTFNGYGSGKPSSSSGWSRISPYGWA